MKIYRHLVQEIIFALIQIFQEGRYADKVIEKSFKSHPKWGSRDRKFFAESVYDLVRYWRLYWFCIDREESFEEEALYELFGAWFLLKYDSLPDWIEFKELRKEELTKRYNESQLYPSIKESYPEWMTELFTRELGEDSKEVLHSLNQKAPIVLRVNLLKTNINELIKKLSEEGVEASAYGEDYPDALVLNKRTNVFITKAFKDGLFEMQDGSSQKVAHFMKVKPGLKIIDACAGAGGKTLHIAGLMKNKGKILSLDIDESKLKELRKRARRAGADIIETKKIESSKTIKRLFQKADRLLLDVPCSGVGVLRRNPDAKWKLTLEKILELQRTQESILDQYSSMVAPQGYMIYATCSILPSENSHQVFKFLEKNRSQWALEEEKTIMPHKSSFDGFYMARLKKNSE